MRVMLRVMLVLVGAITLLMGGAMAVARAWTATPPSAWIAFRGQTLPPSTGQITPPRGEGGIFVVRVDGRVRRRVIEIEPVGNDWVRDLQWSPDGEWLLFTSDLNQSLDVYRVRVNGRQLQDLTGSSGNNASPAWSPDGRWIAFMSDRAGDFALYRMRPDGGDVQQLVAAFDQQRLPVWSPDGEWIAFVGLESDGAQDIYRVRADGTGLQRLTNNPQWFKEKLVWSADGAWLIFQAQRTDGARAVFRLSVDSGDLQSLTAWKLEEYFQSISPDGEWAVTSRMESTGLKLFRMRFDGGDVRFVNPAEIRRSGNQRGGLWTADGRWIAYMGGNSSILYRLPSAGGAAQQLTAPNLIVSSPVWSPPIRPVLRWWVVVGAGTALVLAGIALKPPA
jgi:Tol biopolymer transport system component